jgi:hypothetical protein
MPLGEAVAVAKESVVAKEERGDEVGIGFARVSLCRGISEGTYVVWGSRRALTLTALKRGQM